MSWKICILAVFLVTLTNLETSLVSGEPLPQGDIQTPPPFHYHVRQVCDPGDTVCEKKEAARETESQKEQLAKLRKWISRMGPNTRKSWRRIWPYTAGIYDALEVKFSKQSK